MHEENGNLRTGMADDTKKGTWTEKGMGNTRNMKENGRKGRFLPAMHGDTGDGYSLG